MKNNNKQKQQGFTIVEVLLAAVLLAAGLVTIFSIVNKSVFSHYELFKSETAVRLANESMAMVRVRLADLPANKNTLAGAFPSPLEKFSWKAKINETEQENLVQVTVTIVRTGSTGQKEFSLSTYMFR